MFKGLLNPVQSTRTSVSTTSAQNEILTLSASLNARSTGGVSTLVTHDVIHAERHEIFKFSCQQHTNGWLEFSGFVSKIATNLETFGIWKLTEHGSCDPETSFG